MTVDVLTQDAAEDRCRYWQNVLRLVDWDVQIRIARLGELGVSTLGECDPHRVKRQARIRLLDQRDVEGQCFHFDGDAWDWEVTLVHELLHLHFHDVVTGWNEDRADAKAAERTIDACAKALVTLNRQSAHAVWSIRDPRA